MLLFVEVDAYCKICIAVQDYRFEMDTKESAKVELVEQGRQLMKASSEIRATDINNKVAKLEDKWRHLKAVIAYRY